MTIFFDLDGPILNNKIKYHSLHCDLLTGKVKEFIDIELYWKLKREQVSENKILKYYPKDIDPDVYTKNRINIIEDPNYLSLDKIQPGIYEFLEKLLKKNKLYIVTFRNNRKNLLEQLNHLKLSKYFTEIINEGNLSNDKAKTKSMMLKPFLEDPNEALIIGDTETDIISGKEMGIKTIAINSGIRTKNFLLLNRPDYFFEYTKDINIIQ